MRTLRMLPARTRYAWKKLDLAFRRDIPIERQMLDLPDTAPGAETTLELAFTQSEAPIHVQINVLRPTSFSVYLFDWRP